MSWLLHSKLAAPSAPPDALRRPCLPALTALPPVTLVTAGPGYGKTLALLALFAEAEAAGAQAVWYTLDADDAEVATFFHYVVAGVQAHVPQFGAAIKAMLQADRADAKALFAQLFAELASFNLPRFVLVLDDAHHLAGPLAEALGTFLDKLPPGVHLVLASRQRYPWSLSRLKLKGRVVTIEQEAMRFTPEEAEAFLAARAGGRPVPEAWRAELARLDGWPLGLDLVTSVPAGHVLQWDRAALGEYVAEELYLNQAPARRAFMLRASWLEELTPQACRAILEADDAAFQLEGLERDHLIQRLPRAEAHRFPPYLRDFLRQEATRQLPDLASLHARAAGHYQAEGMPELAIPHRIASRDWDGAIAAIAEHWPAMTLLGRRARAFAWVAAFPEAVRDREPMLQLWLGHAHYQDGRHDEALAPYLKAEKGFAARGDQAGELKALVRQTTLALLRGDREGFNRLVARAQALLEVGAAEDLADWYLLRAMAGEQEGAIGIMQEANEAVLALAVGDNVEVASCHCIALMNMFTFWLHRGELARARAALARLVETAERWQFVSYRLFAGFLIAHLDMLEGDREAAAAWFRGVPAAWGEVLDWHERAVALAIWAQHHHQQDDAKAADAALVQARATFDRAGFTEGGKLVLAHALEFAITRRQPGKLEALVAEAEGAIVSLQDMALAVLRARALHLLDRGSEGLKVLEAVLPLLEREGAKLHVARARLVQAAILQAAGSPQAAASLKAAHALIEAHGYGFLLEEDAALREAVAPPELQAWQTRVVPTAGGLELRCFGSLEVRVDGARVEAWPRKKAKVLLAALALYPRGLSALELAEMLGGDALESANVVRVNMFALRRALEPTLEKRDESRFVRLADDRYVLAAENVAQLDLAAFDAAIAEAERLREATPLEAVAAYDMALGLYRDNLLLDGFMEPYFEAERERYRRQAVDALLWQARFAASLGEHSRAEAALKRAAELAPCEEEVYTQLMRHHLAQGRPERVRQAYWDYRKALKAATGLAPGEAFEAAYRELAPA